MGSNLGEDGSGHTVTSTVSPGTVSNVKPAQQWRKPRAILTALEPTRAWVEFGAYLSTWPALRLAAPGDGHPVIVLPGFFAGDPSTRTLRNYLRSRGYAVSGWSLGRNRGPTRAALDGMDRLVSSTVEQHNQPVSIIGWSLGGIFARQIAARRPEDVRQVITLGSPYRLNPGDRTRASQLYDRFAHLHVTSAYFPGPAGGWRPLPMPATSIYTRSDGIVAWQTCTEPESALSENIEVFGSHCGLGHHPAAVYAVADRLAQPVGGWSPFHPPKLLRHLYPA